MTLGEKIYELRTKQGLSQGDLAEQLNVSRQSISKWETGSSTPDLDKLIKMSQLFQLTLDELVLDKKPGAEKTAGSTDSFSESTQDKTESQFSHERQQSHEPHFPTRKIAGTILLCMGFLTFILALLLNGSWPSLILAVPFLLCGIICFVFRKHAGLWCGWLLFLIIDALYFTISWEKVLINLLYWNTYFTAENILSLLLLLCLIVLIISTVIPFSKKEVCYSNRMLILHLVGWIIYLILTGLVYFVSPRVDNFLLLYPPFSWARVLLLINLLISFIRFWRYHRSHTAE